MERPIFDDHAFRHALDRLFVCRRQPRDRLELQAERRIGAAFGLLENQHIRTHRQRQPPQDIQGRLDPCCRT
ncbi:MAG: hypothetical protein IPK63_01430 [Candidatus Competibacteraceae bacterium]|nr:hypothetical protein [Candidatus Competibacteraceae bacterium]